MKQENTALLFANHLDAWRNSTLYNMQSSASVLSLQEVKSVLRSILERYSVSDGMPINLLCAHFKKQSGCLLNNDTVKPYGCERVVDLLRKLNDLVELQHSHEFRYIVHLRKAVDIKCIEPHQTDQSAHGYQVPKASTSKVDELVRRRVLHLFSTERRAIKLDEFMDTYEDRFGDRPDVVRYGFLQLSHFIKSMSDLFELLPSSDDALLLEIRVRDPLPPGYALTGTSHGAPDQRRMRRQCARDREPNSKEPKRRQETQTVDSTSFTCTTQIGFKNTASTHDINRHVNTPNGNDPATIEKNTVTRSSSTLTEDLELFMREFSQPRELEQTQLDTLLVQSLLAAHRGAVPSDGVTPDELANHFYEHVGTPLKEFGPSTSTIATTHKHLFATSYSLDAYRASLLRLRPQVEATYRKQSIPVVPHSPSSGFFDVAYDAVTSLCVQFRVHNLRLPQHNNVCLAEVTYVNSPSNFWFMEVAERSSVANRSLVNEINEHYNLVPVCSAYSMPDAYIRRGQVCVALYQDELTGCSDWFRAWIRAPLNRARKRPISVYYVDYGEVGWVARDHVRFIAMPFMRMPAQAVHSRLHGVVPSNGTVWSKEARDLMVRLVRDRTLVARVNHFDPSGHVVVELCDTSQKAVGGNDKCVFIARELIQAGLAKAGDERTVPLLNDVNRVPQSQQLAEVGNPCSSKSAVQTDTKGEISARQIHSESVPSRSRGQLCAMMELDEPCTSRSGANSSVHHERPGTYSRSSSVLSRPLCDIEVDAPFANSETNAHGEEAEITLQKSEAAVQQAMGRRSEHLKQISTTKASYVDHLVKSSSSHAGSNSSMPGASTSIDRCHALLSATDSGALAAANHLLMVATRSGGSETRTTRSNANEVEMVADTHSVTCSHSSRAESFKKLNCVESFGRSATSSCELTDCVAPFESALLTKGQTISDPNANISIRKPLRPPKRETIDAFAKSLTCE